MHPALFSLRWGENELGLHTYGVLVAVGFAVGIVLFWREGQRQGLDGGRLLDLSFWGIVAGLIGSRAAFVALNAGAFIDACFGATAAGGPGRISGCTAALRFWEGGFVFYGGAVATGMVVLVFCRSEGWPFWRVGDLAAPSLAVGHAIGRLGCFFAGCCFGKACPSGWGVSFPSGSVAYDELQSVGALAEGSPHTLSLHPTQLYESAGELAIFLLLLLLRRSWRAEDVVSENALDNSRRAPRPAGGLLLFYVAAYAVLRFFVEMFRGDFSRRYLVEWHWPRLATLLGLPPAEPLFLSVSQFTSILMLAGVLTTIMLRRRHLSPARVEGPG